MKRSEIAELLPAVFQRTLNARNPLTGLLEVMESLQEPSEAVLARLDAIFDPRRTADEFVPFLAYWTNLTKLFDDSVKVKGEFDFSRANIATGVGRLRELTASAAYLSQWRGTQRAYCCFCKRRRVWLIFSFRKTSIWTATQNLFTSPFELQRKASSIES